MRVRGACVLCAPLRPTAPSLSLTRTRARAPLSHVNCRCKRDPLSPLSPVCWVPLTFFAHFCCQVNGGARGWTERERERQGTVCRLCSCFLLPPPARARTHTSVVFLARRQKGPLSLLAKVGACQIDKSPSLCLLRYVVCLCLCVCVSRGQERGGAAAACHALRTRPFLACLCVLPRLFPDLRVRVRVCCSSRERLTRTGKGACAADRDARRADLTSPACSNQEGMYSTIPVNMITCPHDSLGYADASELDYAHNWPPAAAGRWPTSAPRPAIWSGGP